MKSTKSKSSGYSSLGGTKTLGIGSPKRKPKKNGATIGFTVWYQVKQEKNAMLS